MKRALQFLILAGMLLAGKSFALPSCSSTGYINTHCSGKKVYSEGTYVGDLQDGWPHGQGTYTWTDGRKYVGEWQNNSRHGKGVFTWPNGRKYVGEYRENKQWNGKEYWGQELSFIYRNGQAYTPEQIASSSSNASSSSSSSSSGGGWCVTQSGVKKVESQWSACSAGTYFIDEYSAKDYWNRIFPSSNTSSSSSSSSSNDPQGWCVWGGANNWRKAPFKKSQCQGANEYWFTSESAAQSRLNQLQNQVSSSSANQSGWCVWSGASGWQKSFIQKRHCQGANDHWFTSEWAANNKLNELKSQSASSSSSGGGWCVTQSGVKEVGSKWACSGKYFPQEYPAKAYWNRTFGSSNASNDPQGWCVWGGANNWRKAPFKKSQCQGANEYWFTSESAAQSKLNQLKSQSASSSSSYSGGGWCVWNSAGTWIKRKLGSPTSCQGSNDHWFTSESAANNKLNELKSQSSSSNSSNASNNPQGWCVWGGANNWRNTPLSRSTCQETNEYWFTSESAAQSKLNELKSQSASSSSSNAPDDEPGLLLYFILLGVGILIFVFVSGKKSPKTKSVQEPVSEPRTVVPTDIDDEDDIDPETVAIGERERAEIWLLLHVAGSFSEPDSVRGRVLREELVARYGSIAPLAEDDSIERWAADHGVTDFALEEASAVLLETCTRYERIRFVGSLWKVVLSEEPANMAAMAVMRKIPGLLNISYIDQDKMRRQAAEFFAAQRQATESAEPEPAEPEPVQETPERDLDSSPQIDPASEITQPEIIETARIDETAEAAPEAETPTDLETRLEQRFEQMEQQIEEKEQVFEELNKALESRQAEDQRWKNAMLRKGRRSGKSKNGARE